MEAVFISMFSLDAPMPIFLDVWPTDTDFFFKVL